MYIHEHPNWPILYWDSEKLATLLAAIRHQQGFLLGRMSALGFEIKAEASLEVLAADIVKSNQIEGEVLNPAEVRSSIATKLGVEIGGLVPVGRYVDGVVDMMLDATLHYQDALTEERLFDWHGALFPTGRSGMHKITVGSWRTFAAGLYLVHLAKSRFTLRRQALIV